MIICLLVFRFVGDEGMYVSSCHFECYGLYEFFNFFFLTFHHTNLAYTHIFPNVILFESCIYLSCLYFDTRRQYCYRDTIYAESYSRVQYSTNGQPVNQVRITPNHLVFHINSHNPLLYHFFLSHSPSNPLR